MWLAVRTSILPPDDQTRLTTHSVQYCSALILLHRSTARFGIAPTNASPPSLEARRICVHNATQIIHMIQDYRAHHGSASTMLGTALYNVTIAGIVLIANMADGSASVDSQQLLCIDTCIRSLEEMELSSQVAQKVLKQLRYLMRRCNLRFVPANAQASGTAALDSVPQQQQHLMAEQDLLAEDVGPCLDALLGPEGDASSSPHDFLQIMTECDVLNSLGSWDWQV